MKHITYATITIEVSIPSKMFEDEGNDNLLSSNLTRLEDKVEELLFEVAKENPYFSFDVISKGF